MRPLLECVAAGVIATRIFGTALADRCFKVLGWVLWISAAVTLAGATTGLEVGGRTEDASLTLVSGNSAAATRLLTEATFPALAVLCGVIALSVAGRIRIVDSWALSVPALLITVLSFSRNSILAVAVAILFAVVAGRSVGAVVRASLVVVSTLAVFGLLVLLGPVLATLPGGDFVNTQVHSYSDRVIGGLTSTVQSTDPSVQFRARENSFLMQGFLSSPFIGHGFGFAYKPSAGTASFLLDYAPYFAHNFYGWIAVKGGAVSCLLLVAAFASPLLRATKRASTATFALAAAFVAMLAVSIVAPVALSTNSALLFGGLLGALAASTDMTPRTSQYSNRGRCSRHAESAGADTGARCVVPAIAAAAVVAVIQVACVVGSSQGSPQARTEQRSNYIAAHSRTARLLACSDIEIMSSSEI